MLIKELCDVQKITINPQKQENVLFTHYSLPSFDNNKTPDIVYGKEILSSKYVVPKNVILYNKLNLRFKRIWNIKNNTKINCICSGEFIPLVIKNNIILQDYLYYYLLTDKLNKKLLETAHGTSSSHQRIDINDLLNYEIKVPSMEEQLHIVDTIGSIDDLIDNLTNQISKYKEIMSKELSKLTSKSTSTIKLSSIVKESKEKIKNNDVKLMSVVNTSNLVLQEEYFNKNTASKDMCKYKILKKYYFAYNPARINIGSIGMHNYDILGAISPIYIVFTVDNNYIYYLDIFKSSEYMIKNINKKASGSVRQNLPFEQFASIEIPNIDLNELINFNLHCQTFYSQIKSTENEIQQLINLKNKYLQKFFA